MKIEKIDHIAIRVKNLEEAKSFFGGLFETKFTPVLETPEFDITSIIEPSGIELVAPLAPDGPTAKGIESRGEGLVIISLKVRGIDEAMEEMKSRGIRLVAQLDDGRVKAVLYHPADLFGVMVELIEYEPAEHDVVIAARQ